MLKFIDIHCVFRQKYRCTNVVVVTLFAFLLSLCLNAHLSYAESTSSRSVAYAKAQAAKKAGGSNDVTSYFRHDPYGPNTYAFGYEVNDNRTGNIQFRDERRYVNGSVEGSFGHVRPDGRVTVTHFLADKEHGFLHDTQTYEPGEHHKWQAHWPTKRPDIIMQRPPDVATGTVIYDKDLHLNVTSGKIPDSMAQALEQQHGIDVNRVDLQEGIIDPALQDIIGGKIPLQQLPGKQQTQIGFDTVNNFIPPDFPIVPFQLPTSLNETKEANAENAEDTAKEDLKTMQKEQEQQQQINKYERAKANNDEKSMNVEALRKTADVLHEKQEPLLPSDNQEPASGAAQTSSASLTAAETNIDRHAWYEQIIDDTRNEFLQEVPILPET